MPGCLPTPGVARLPAAAPERLALYVLLSLPPSAPRRGHTAPRRGAAPAAVRRAATAASDDFLHLVNPLLSIDEDGPNMPGREPPDRDDEKEAGRPLFRSVFTFERWAAHRSTRRYSRHMGGMLQSRIVRGLAAPLLYVGGLSTAVAAAHQASEAGALPTLGASLFQLHTEPFVLTSFALSLLLVFRTNASYARWLDARRAWGSLVNRSRDLTRQGLTWLPDDDAPLRAMLCRWTVVFARALKCHLREGEDLGADLAGLLPPSELAALLAARHRPNFALQTLSQVVRQAGVASAAALNMDVNLTSFEDSMGTCERILREPIPLSYTRHTSRFMIIWLSMLPFSLWEPCRWAEVPVCTAVAFLLLGIEEIGVQIEEPFSILPLEAICDTIQDNVAELQEAHQGGGGGKGGGAVGAAALVRAAVARGREGAAQRAQ
jgi:predicted membrane chloride channel (bestrophin family)